MTDSVELINLDKIKKPRKPRQKKVKIIEEPEIIEEEPEEEIQEVDQDELEYYREQLINISERQPEILTQSITTDYSLIDNMDLEEIKARIRLANRVTCSKMDSTVTKNIITLTNQVCGRMLGCLDELESSTENDQLLHATCKDYLGLNLLDKIPTEVKLLGLYGSHVGASYLGSKKPKMASSIEELMEKN